MASDLSSLFGGNGLSQFLGGYASNPQYQQGQIQRGNQKFINDEALKAYNGQKNGQLPQQTVAPLDPNQIAGGKSMISNAQGVGQDLANRGAGTIGTAQGGVGAGIDALSGIAGGLGPQFGSQFAGDYMKSIAPQLLGAQQALNNQANMAWNKGVGGLADSGGFMSSGRNAQLGQAQENAASTLGNQQQMLAYNAAQAAAQAGQQAGMTGYQGKLTAGNALVGNALNAAGQTGAMQGAQMMPGQIQAGVGDMYQNQQQNEMNAKYNNDINQFQNPFKALQNYQAGLGVLGSNNYAPNINMPNNIMQDMNMLGVNPTSLMSGLGQAGIGGLGDMLKSIFGGGSQPSPMMQQTGADIANSNSTGGVGWL